MQVRFTAHAEEQIVLRELDPEQVIAVALRPEQTVYSSGRLPIAQSRITHKGQPALLRVVFADEDDIRWVITVYPTSQMGRYWQEESPDEN